MVWPWGKNSLWTIPLTSEKRSTSLWLWTWTSLLSLALVTLFRSRLCPLVNGSYSKIHDSSSVIVLPSKFGSVSSRVRMSWHTFTRRSFCSSVNNLGTIFAQIFLIPSSSVMIVHTLSLFILNSFVIILTVKRRSLHSFAYWQPPTPGVIFHIFSFFLEPFVPLENSISWHCFISIDLLE